MNLYEISTRYEYLLSLDEYTDEECAELEAIHDSHENACIGRAKYIKNLDAEVDAIDREVMLMEKRSDALRDEADRQKTKLINYMKQGNVDKIKSPIMEITLPKARPSLDIFDRNELPDSYGTFVEVMPVFKINNEEIKKDLLAGKEVPGAKLIYKQSVKFK